MNLPRNLPDRRRVAVLGSTGSIGINTLEVAAALPDRVEVVALCAHSNWQKLFEQTRRFKPRWAVLTDPMAYAKADQDLIWHQTRLLGGEDGVAVAVRDPDLDIVVSAVVGAAGLRGTWGALDAGKCVALANKESLVVGGPLVMNLAREKGNGLLPVDSEHSGLFQALLGGKVAEVERLVLTGSGGPFRGKTAAELANVTPAEALKHPTWQMGKKITVDSATLMNKALEVIEARWLFDLPPEKIDVILHPKSLVHALVEFRDGSVLAQLSPPDMRLPIQYALTWPDRVSGPAQRLNWGELRDLHFEPVDRVTFPSVQLGYEVAARAGTCGAVLNAANEAAVDRFLTGTLRFLDIPRVCRQILDAHSFSPTPSLDELLALDGWARQEVARWTP